MTDLPYTEADLRAEAARQYMSLTEDPEFMCVGEAMEDRYVQSTVVDEDPDFEREGSTWGELLPYNHDDGNAYNEAQRKIHNLIRGAADVSEWAVDLGTDGLEPSPNVLNLDGDGGPIVRLHMAFHPDMDERDRQRFGLALARVMANAL
ncbi:hypothetical protein [Streptomyces wuyuanensis]|uniref:hypothetical protein n=1 Tax=Streptomyces wuyuanensis TaxID=1196353 RepID=UPI0037949497